MTKFSFLILLVVVACNNKSQQEPPHKTYSLVDSTSTASSAKSSENMSDSFEAKRKADSIVNSVIHYAYFDTVGVWNAPIKVLKAWFTRREYSNYKDVALTYKNVSSKRITAIRFSWYGETAFGDPADMGVLNDGFGGGFTETPIKPGGIRSSEWSILSRNGKKIILAWPTEIVFEDGSKWKSSYNNKFR